MSDPNTLAKIRATLAAVKAGAATIVELEAVTGAALRAGSVTATDLASALKPAIAAGHVPAETLAHLGLGTTDAPASPQETRLRRPDTVADARTTAAAQAPPVAEPTAPFVAPGPRDARRSTAMETQLRAAPAPPDSDAEAPSGLSTASNWVEPDSAEAPAEAEVTTGSVLGGRYLLERQLGEGGMGVVYSASDQEVKGEHFAVKVLKSDIRDQPEALSLLREEVRKTRSLGHPNIVGVYSLNSDHGCVYMLMEYLEGKTLDALIDDDFGRGVPFERAWPLIQDIGAALAFAHDRSVIHSDLKPSNIFITTAGRVKLLDFGIARAARGRLRGVDPAALGALTPAYASCEMLEGLQPDARDDIYALACVVYEMLCGKHPFGSRTAVEARDEKLQPAPLAALSRVQNAALAKGLAFDRSERTVSVEALVAGLAARARPSVGRGALAAVVVIGLLIAAGGGWWAWSAAHRNPPVAPAGSSQPTGPGASAALSGARALEAQARSLGVDPGDGAFVTGVQQLRAAEQELAAGDADGGARSLVAAEASLQTALRSGARVARVGSEADEVSLAIRLCSQAGGHCSPAYFDDEAPRTVALQPFALDETGVTTKDFADFARAKGYVTEAERGRGLLVISGRNVIPRPGQSWKTLERQDVAAGVDPVSYPVRGIDFAAAKAYCEWRGRRLPTEEEWEFVARGTERRIFPWGDDPAPIGRAKPTFLPVGAQSATGRFGVRGLGGTLWEWVEGGTPDQRVLRGPSWLVTAAAEQRLAQRALQKPALAQVDIGFRCAQAVEAWPQEAEHPGG